MGGAAGNVVAGGARHQGDAVEDQAPLAFNLGDAQQILAGHQPPECRGVGLVGVHAAQAGETAPIVLGQAGHVAGHAEGNITPRAGGGFRYGNGVFLGYGGGHALFSWESANRKGSPPVPRSRPSKSPVAFSRAR